VIKYLERQKEINGGVYSITKNSAEKQRQMNIYKTRRMSLSNNVKGEKKTETRNSNGRQEVKRDDGPSQENNTL
jgi:hypothetical protein